LIFAQNKSISNDKMECTILKGLIKMIETDILVAIFGVQNKKISMRDHACTRRFQRTQEDTEPKMGPNGHYSGLAGWHPPAQPRSELLEISSHAS
jgi:hypothetical protein